ncbi:MAG: PDZ domain-containing protein [Deltaproteobacteria bacterium]|nr:MAG: PDZ domain-containing protein [Deltaproteobacteria bacterium]
MERRDFLQRAAASLALAMTPAVEGCATIGGPDLASLAKAEPATLGAWLHARTQVIRERAWDSEIVPYALERGVERGLIGDVLTALWSTSTFRDMPQKVQRLPEVQRWMLELGPALARAAFGAADMLEALPDEDLDALDTALAEDEDPIGWFAMALGQRGEEAGISDERRDQSLAVMRQVEWRMKKQSSKTVLQGLVDRVDRECRRGGFRRSEWRERLADEEPGWALLRPAVESVDDAAVQKLVDGVVPTSWTEPLATTGGHLGLWMEETDSGAGVGVSAVRRGSPAAMAGLQSGDVIERIDGVEVGPDALVVSLCAKPAGEAVLLDVRRGEERVSVRAVPADGPGDRMAAVSLTPSEEERFRAMSSAYRIYMLGIGMAKWGSIIFGVGLMALLGGIGLSTVSAFGAGMAVAGGLATVGGLVLMILSLFVIAIGNVGMSQQRREWLDRKASGGRLPDEQ